ncbi:RING-3 [Verticillium alfalfae VaMs.102]|uniref:RING-3 n=1 Tax=Verticillium alfalfae (strain VaMs.102 / ATCC MYA-4576 / FGSC 10136) TaxID=526221 RepID=C9SCM1_VERA1|nr:RING-3 [Verticillium alfalfae VaMs.102]EEY16836.1 RING-3 [Verticillium alfalfae VaMs.102]
MVSLTNLPFPPHLAHPSLSHTTLDHASRPGIRCDGKYPCEQCLNAALTCKRDHVPKKRGPKRGHGRVINELRAKDTFPGQLSLEGGGVGGQGSQDNPTEYVRRRLSAACPPLSFDPSMSDSSANPSAAPSAANSPPQFWATLTSNPGHNVPEPRSAFSSDDYRPNSRSYLYMVPQCVELYYEHIYPIMPLLYMPAIRQTIARPMTPSEKNLIYALCALTSMHMSGKSIEAPGPPSWEVAGRFFLDECISVRQSYDFLEDLSLSAVISSFYLSTSFFEINQSRKSWHYLREALNNAQDLGLQNDSTYYGLSPEDTLCRQRVFWILFVTERSFAILRNKPITFKQTPSLPSTRHSYESPDIHAGFLQLVSSYTPLDESFVTAWNEGSDPRVSAATFVALQNLLALPPIFLRPRSPTSLFAGSTDPSTPEPTDIQKADLLVTQQWLRLIVWQSSMRQQLLSWTNPADAPDPNAPPNSMCFSFPLSVARDTAAILASLPPKAVEVHGMGIMEKIFEIGTWCVNVLGACESVGFAPGGMDLTAGDLGVLNTGRRSSSKDPIEFFVRTLSASPNRKGAVCREAAQGRGENQAACAMGLGIMPVDMAAAAAAAAAATAGGLRGDSVDLTSPLTMTTSHSYSDMASAMGMTGLSDWSEWSPETGGGDEAAAAFAAEDGTGLAHVVSRSSAGDGNENGTRKEAKNIIHKYILLGLLVNNSFRCHARSNLAFHKGFGVEV